MSDVDVVWFEDPQPALHAAARAAGAHFAVQSNAPDQDPPNGARRINSGFYLAEASEDAVAAMRQVRHAPMASLQVYAYIHTYTHAGTYACV